VADLFGLGWLPLVEQKQRHRQLITGIAELAGGWPGDPAQTQALRLAFKGDVWAGIGAIDRDLDVLPLGRAAPELFLGSIGRSAVIPQVTVASKLEPFSRMKLRPREEGNQLRRVLA
jgi:hypothetical protein